MLPYPILIAMGTSNTKTHERTPSPSICDEKNAIPHQSPIRTLKQIWEGYYSSNEEYLRTHIDVSDETYNVFTKMNTLVSNLSNEKLNILYLKKLNSVWVKLTHKFPEGPVHESAKINLALAKLIGIVLTKKIERSEK